MVFVIDGKMETSQKEVHHYLCTDVLIVMCGQNEWDCDIHVAVYSIVLHSVCTTVELISQVPFIVSEEKWAVSGRISSPPTVSNERQHF